MLEAWSCKMRLVVYYCTADKRYTFRTGKDIYAHSTQRWLNRFSLGFQVISSSPHSETLAQGIMNTQTRFVTTDLGFHMVLCYISTRGMNRVRGWTPGGQVRHQEDLLERKLREMEGAQDKGSGSSKPGQPQPLLSIPNPTWWSWCPAVQHNSFDHKDWWRWSSRYLQWFREECEILCAHVCRNRWLHLSRALLTIQSTSHICSTCVRRCGSSRKRFIKLTLLALVNDDLFLVNFTGIPAHTRPGTTNATQALNYQRGLEKPYYDGSSPEWNLITARPEQMRNPDSMVSWIVWAIL